MGAHDAERVDGRGQVLAFRPLSQPSQQAAFGHALKGPSGVSNRSSEVAVGQASREHVAEASRPRRGRITAPRWDVVRRIWRLDPRLVNLVPKCDAEVKRPQLRSMAKNTFRIGDEPRLRCQGGN